MRLKKNIDSNKGKWIRIMYEMFWKVLTHRLKRDKFRD